MDAKQLNAPYRDPGNEAILLEVSCGCGWHYQFEHALLERAITPQELADMRQLVESFSADEPLVVVSSGDKIVPRDVWRTA